MGGPSPQQRRGSGRTWRAPTTRDFLRNLQWRARLGEVYAVTGQCDRADILVRSAAPGDERWVRLYTYPVLGLRAMREAGLLPMERVDAVPGFDVEAELYKTEASRQRWGEELEFWRLLVASDTAE